MRGPVRVAVAAVAAIVVGLTLAVSGGFAWDDTSSQSGPPVPAGGIDPAALATANDVDATVAALQARLRDQPSDARSWATLGLAYVEQARVSGDPSFYPRAAGALDRSLTEQPVDNALALAGQAALASARHLFGAALRRSEQALAINPYDLGALAVRVDALTELGRYRTARTALAQADRRRPSVQIFARYSYAYELRGRTGEAARLLERAVTGSSAPADRAYLLSLLADLHRKAGQLAASGRALTQALEADPESLAASASRARLAVARGDLGEAARRWRELVERAPLPEYVLALGELYAATDRPAQARRQFDVLEATAQLARGNGVDTGLETARYQADHGEPAAALESARTAWRKAPSIWAADALAWALHRKGRDEPALRRAREATRLGTPDPLLWTHRGAIEASLGRDVPAATHLRRGLTADPGLSPWQRDAAEKVLVEVVR